MLIKRASNLLFGGIAKLIRGAEERNPGLLIEKLNYDIDKKIEAAKDRICKIKVDMKIAEKRNEQEKEKMRGLKKSIAEVIKAKDEALLTQLYIEESTQTKVIEETENFFNELKVMYEKAKVEFDMFCNEAQAQKSKLNLLNTQAEINKLRNEIVSTFDLSTGKLNDVGKVEEIVTKQKYTAEAKNELKEESLTEKIKKVNYNSMVEEAKERAKKAISDSEG
jgi:hypothetical protein